MKKIYLFPLFLLLVIGVDAQNFWSQDAVPSGGSVTRLDRTDAGTLYALMQDWDLQVYRSSDDGHSWSYVPTPVSGTSTSFNGFFVGKSGALYTVQDDNIQRSTDNGASWSAINPPGFNTGDPVYLAGVFILEVSPNVLLLGSGYNDGGIWRSVDGGISWTHVYDTFTGFAGHNRLLQVSDQEVFAISASYSDDFLYSSDAGISWTLIDGNNFSIGESGGMLARKPGGPLFACSESTVIRSTDGGYNWEDISPALPNNGAFAGFSSFCFSPNGRVFLGGLSGSYYSDDDGLSWIPVPNRHLSAFPMVGSLPDGVLFSSSGDALYRSNDDGATWHRTTQGINRASLSELFWTNQDTLIARTYDGAFRSIDAGYSWTTIWEDSTSYYSLETDMDFRADGRLSIVSPHGVLFSSDYGNTFKEIKPVDFEVPFGYYGSTAVGPDKIVFISSAGGCWRSADAGTTWSKVMDSLTLREMICPNTGPFLALAYENNASSVYLSFDKGVTWEPIAGLQYIYALALGQDGNLYAGDNPIFKSRDGGLTWLQLPHSAPGFTQAILVNRAGHIFTEDGGGTEKIYRSIDEGQSWNALPGTGTHPSLTAISPDQRLHIGHYYGDNLVTTAPTTDIALLSGVLRFDTDADCLPKLTDSLLRQWLIRTDQNGYIQYATTKASDGRYLSAAFEGEVSLEAVAPGVYWESCPEVLTVTPADFMDTLQVPDLAAAPEVFCPLLEVNLGTALLRRCFDNTYVVHYANRGTTPALQAEAEITLDPWFTYLSADRPLISQSGQTLRFALGDLPPNAAGQFSIQFNISCDAPLGALHATAAHLYSDTLCGPLAWPGAVIRAGAACLGDTAVAFTLTNTGGQPTAMPLPWAVCANWCGQDIGNGTFSLGAGQSQTFTFPVDLSDPQFEFSLAADQEAGYPFGTKLSASIVGCLDLAGWTQPGYTLLPDNAGEPFLDLDQQWNNGSWDPNEKSADPAGTGPQHFIRPQTPIQYLIRFQNTGTDTAFTVSIRDTLSALLDPASFRVGASSHPFTWEMTGGGNLVFRFDPILLPDSNINEAASHGFVQYSVKPKAAAPLGGIIRNRAAIYFDFNLPVHTNEVWHTLSEDFSSTGTTGPAGAENSPVLLASPNPFSEYALFSWKNLPEQARWLEITDGLGMRVWFQTLGSGTEQIDFRRGALPSGVYTVSIFGKKGWMASARLLAR